MAPEVPSRPQHTCANFPLCGNSQHRTRSAEGSRERSAYCQSCYSRSICTFSGCENPSAPGSGRYETPYCALHYRDPCNTSQRHWKLCCNSRIGCQYLSQHARIGKCFACAMGNVPCAHSLLGCSKHVRSTAPISLSKRPACSAKNGTKCPFDHTNADFCSSRLCGLHRTSASDVVCSDCAAGRLPCPNRCSRRTECSSQKLCSTCSAAQIPNSIEALVNPIEPPFCSATASTFIACTRRTDCNSLSNCSPLSSLRL